MKTLLVAATALTMAGSALAYQTYGTDVDSTTTAASAQVDGTTTASTGIDPNVALAPPHSWTIEQRALWDQHMAALPSGWTAEQRANFEAMLAIPPTSWTAEQRSLYEQHMASLPASWTVEQRASYQQQVAELRTPWLTTQVQQSASVQPGTTGIAQPDLSTFAGMGGPYEEVYGDGTVSATPRAADRNYPPCSPGPGDDSCIQLYERGVRAQLASWNRPTGGLAGEGTTAMGGPYEPVEEADTTTSSPQPEHSDHMRGTPDPAGTTQDDTVEPAR